MRRIVDAVLVNDKDICECTDLQQSMPISGVSRQTRYFQSHYDPGVPQAHLGDQALKARAIDRGCSGLSEVRVDDDDLLDRSAERDCPLPQIILTLRAFAVLEHLS